MAQILVYDGGCPFCLHFALRSELVGGLPDLEIQYSDYALWQREHLNAEFLKSKLIFWKNKLQYKSVVHNTLAAYCVATINCIIHKLLMLRV